MDKLSIDQSGLVWEPKPFFAPARVHPRWSKNPDLKAIKTALLQEVPILQGHDIDVAIFAEGVLNKAYRVHDATTGASYIRRLSMPLNLYYKTATEVATLDYLERYTKLPSPKVYAQNVSSNNIIGYEWILMSLMPGISVQFCWHKLTKEELRKIVKQFATYQAELFSHQFLGLGGLQKNIIGVTILIECLPYRFGGTEEFMI